MYLIINENGKHLASTKEGLQEALAIAQRLKEGFQEDFEIINYEKDNEQKGE